MEISSAYTNGESSNSADNLQTDMLDVPNKMIENKTFKDEVNNECIANGKLSSSADDSVVSVSDVITKSMIDEEKALERKAIKEEKELKEQIAREKKEKFEEEQCYNRLNLLLSRSQIYAEYMAKKLERDNLKEEKRRKRAEKMQPKILEQKKRKIEANTAPPKKRSRYVYDSNEEEEEENEENIENGAETETKVLPDNQPSLLTGGIMHPYQIDGFKWLQTLYENGVNGILADEMGLGKTIQTIAFIAHLVENGVTGPFFICGPLSTVTNWYAEFKRFAPNIPAIVYHGQKPDRKEMRKKILRKVKSNNVCSFPVVITSYQIALMDANVLSHYEWRLLVIDEGHRIKNFQCKLVTSLKLYDAPNRLLLTGTPLQNDLSELWSLLNFILPEIFDDLKVFESWFDISRLTENGATDEIIAKEQEKHIVSMIHQILTPFLLRRTKAEVQLKLPPKKEVIVPAPLTQLQQEYYTAVLNKTIQTEVGLTRGRYFEVDINLDRNSRKKAQNFDHIYNMMDDVEPEEISNIVKKFEPVAPKAQPEDVFADIKLNIRNVTMLLRKVCGHPYLISYPLDATTGGYKIDEDLIKSSGKLLVLDAMLPELKKRGHKVLLFSQFVTMLEILEDYCMYRKYNYNMICGDMNLEKRQSEIDYFSNSEDSFIFLISTKAGGLGINLAKADTVIIYDSDWNPQGDIQAQDRAHRIGQTKPVVVYRLVIPNTVDQKIIDRATAKRKLEKVIIKKGRFNSKHSQSQTKLSVEDLLELLQSCELAGFGKNDDNSVLSPSELNKLLDRSDMAEQE